MGEKKISIAIPVYCLYNDDVVFFNIFSDIKHLDCSELNCDTSSFS